jgi:anti-sigma regulatory factor (Ser/Thr protein kinase)
MSLEPAVQAIAILLLSELVSNSVRHSGCVAPEQVEIAVEMTGPVVRVAVTDPGAGARIAPSTTPDHAGLRIVDRLSDRWGVEHDPTTVWFEVRS